MKAVIQNYNTGELAVVDTAAPQCRSGHVLVRNGHSVISAGTEKTKVDTGQKSLLGKAMARPDLVKKVIEKAKKEGLWKTWRTVSDRLSTPITLGYSCAGEVIGAEGEVGDLCVGDRVACGGGSANHAEIVCVPKNLAVPIPEGLGTDQASFATLGAIAMQGVRQAGVELGERVAVIGLGLIGLLTIQILKASGCRVMGLDVDAARLKLALGVGCHEAVLGSDPALLERVLTFTDGYGVDATIITAATPSNQPITQAGEITREKGRVVMVGLAGMDVPREPFYMKEIDLRLSRSYGPGRYDPAYEEHGLDYPYGYVRFTERRNMASFLDLVRDEQVDLGRIISHRFAIDEAARAYDLIRGERKEPYLGILLEYGRELGEIARRLDLPVAAAVSGRIKVGVVGAGKYATTNLLPHLAKNRDVTLAGVCTGSGVTARHAAQQFGFAALESAPGAVMDAADAVVIATRHHLHAAQAAEALQKGRHVFVEKPLVLSRAELDAVTAALMEGGGGTVMVGFNRRFAPATLQMLDHFRGVPGPRQVLIRVNAGPIPKDHWIQDLQVGGGRLMGEGCHFVDLAVALCGARIRRVHASAVPQAGREVALWDDFSIGMTLENGSTATVVYTAGGDTGVAKERIEMHAGGRSAINDDFSQVQLWADGRQKTMRSPNQDKGQKQQMTLWVEGMKEGRSPIAFEEIANVHLACLGAIESIRQGAVVEV